jgi:hypothetical protein
MADFSLTTLFVVPSGGYSASAASNALTPGQLGIYIDTHANATTGNIAGAKFFYLAQGRANDYLLGSKKSGKIHASRVTSFTKVVGNATVQPQITEVEFDNISCGETVTLSIRVFSQWAESIAPYGFLKSVTVKAPCCPCSGPDPCTEVDYNAFINNVIAEIDKQVVGVSGPGGPQLKDYLTFQNIAGPPRVLRITAKPVVKFKNPHDPSAFPYEYDRVSFKVYVYKGPAVASEQIINDACEKAGTVTTTQVGTFPRGTPDEIRQLERWHYSYQAGYMTHLHKMAGYNQNFESYVNDSVAAYDTLYINFYEQSQGANISTIQSTVESKVIIAGTPTDVTAIQTVLAAALGAPTVINA